MGLFQRNYVEKIKDLVDRIEEVSLTEDDLILKFREKVTEIEEYDIECIRLIKRLASEGHLSEKLKRALINQLLFLLRRLERLKFENKERLRQIKDEVESFLMLELTVERIGVNVNRPLYHGSMVAGMRALRIELLYVAWLTLGGGVYCTDNRNMSINYAFYRHYTESSRLVLVKRLGKNYRPTVYTVRVKKGKDFIADLSEPRKIAAIYKSLDDFCAEELRKLGKLTPENESAIVKLVYFRQCLWELLKKKQLLTNIRHLLDKGKFAEVLVKFLKSLGYHGLRSKESGELGLSYTPPFPWETSLTYVIFDPNDVEIISEEHYKLVNGKVVKC